MVRRSRCFTKRVKPPRSGGSTCPARWESSFMFSMLFLAVCNGSLQFGLVMLCVLFIFIFYFLKSALLLN